MRWNNLVQHYEKSIEHREALWILVGREVGRISPAQKKLLSRDVDHFVEDAHRLSPGFRLMIAQCLQELLKKYEMALPPGLKLEVSASPLKEYFEDELTPWQITLRNRVFTT